MNTGSTHCARLSCAALSLARRALFLAGINLWLSGTAHAAELAGDLQRSNFRSSVCNIASMDVSFRIEETFGEPVLTSKMRWQAGPNTNIDCLSKLTHMWVTVRTEADALRYIKFRPDIVPAAQQFGPTATESPNWDDLLCRSPSDAALCDPADRAQQLVVQGLSFEGFEVVSESRTMASTESRSASEAGRRSQTSDDDFSLESMLNEAIDSSMAPGGAEAATAAQGTTEAAPDPAQATDTDRESVAEDAMNNVVSLIASSLAQYTTPAHQCESRRIIGNWVQARSTCELNFRSESNHSYLCNENGRSTPVRSTQKANVDFSAGIISHISDIRVSDDGWAALVLELKRELNDVVEGNYKTNRWQFTTSSAKKDDLQSLARSMMTLKEYCEAGSLES